MKTAKVLRVKTKAAARIVVRNGAEKKLFDMDVLGVSITVAVPPDAEIRIDPSLADVLRIIRETEEPKQ